MAWWASCRSIALADSALLAGVFVCVRTRWRGAAGVERSRVLADRGVRASRVGRCAGVACGFGCGARAAQLFRFSFAHVGRAVERGWPRVSALNRRSAAPVRAAPEEVPSARARGRVVFGCGAAIRPAVSTQAGPGASNRALVRARIWTGRGGYRAAALIHADEHVAGSVFVAGGSAERRNGQ